eukprot:ANDGO_02928.mRNA.1 hypothetical protein ACA1_145570
MKLPSDASVKAKFCSYMQLDFLLLNAGSLSSSNATAKYEDHGANAAQLEDLMFAAKDMAFQSLRQSSGCETVPDLRIAPVIQGSLQDTQYVCAEQRVPGHSPTPDSDADGADKKGLFAASSPSSPSLQQAERQWEQLYMQATVPLLFRPFRYFPESLVRLYFPHLSVSIVRIINSGNDALDLLLLRRTLKIAHGRQFRLVKKARTIFSELHTRKDSREAPETERGDAVLSEESEAGMLQFCSGRISALRYAAETDPSIHAAWNNSLKKIESNMESGTSTIMKLRANLRRFIQLPELITKPKIEEPLHPKGCIIVQILECKDLLERKAKKPYVTVTLDGGDIRQTAVGSCARSPVWNSEIFSFNLPSREKTDALFLQVFSNDTSSYKNQFLGQFSTPVASLEPGKVCDQWATLQKRSYKSHVAGQIHFLVLYEEFEDAEGDKENFRSSSRQSKRASLVEDCFEIASPSSGHDIFRELVVQFVHDAVASQVLSKQDILPLAAFRILLNVALFYAIDPLTAQLLLCQGIVKAWGGPQIACLPAGQKPAALPFEAFSKLCSSVLDDSAAENILVPAVLASCADNIQAPIVQLRLTVITEICQFGIALIQQFDKIFVDDGSGFGLAIAFAKVLASFPLVVDVQPIFHNLRELFVTVANTKTEEYIQQWKAKFDKIWTGKMSRLDDFEKEQLAKDTPPSPSPSPSPRAYATERVPELKMSTKLHRTDALEDVMVGRLVFVVRQTARVFDGVCARYGRFIPPWTTFLTAMARTMLRYVQFLVDEYLNRRSIITQRRHTEIKVITIVRSLQYNLSIFLDESDTMDINSIFYLDISDYLAELCAHLPAFVREEISEPDDFKPISSETPVSQSVLDLYSLIHLLFLAFCRLAPANGNRCASPTSADPQQFANAWQVQLASSLGNSVQVYGDHLLASSRIILQSERTAHKSMALMRPAVDSRVAVVLNNIFQMRSFNEQFLDLEVLKKAAEEASDVYGKAVGPFVLQIESQVLGNVADTIRNAYALQLYMMIVLGGLSLARSNIVSRVIRHPQASFLIQRARKLKERHRQDALRTFTKLLQQEIQTLSRTLEKPVFQRMLRSVFENCILKIAKEVCFSIALDRRHLHVCERIIQRLSDTLPVVRELFTGFMSEHAADSSVLTAEYMASQFDDVLKLYSTIPVTDNVLCSVLQSPTADTNPESSDYGRETALVFLLVRARFHRSRNAQQCIDSILEDLPSEMLERVHHRWDQVLGQDLFRVVT